VNGPSRHPDARPTDVDIGSSIRRPRSLTRDCVAPGGSSLPRERRGPCPLSVGPL